MEINHNGDNYVSPFDRKLWDFIYTVLLKFQCPIQYKILGPDVPRRIDQHIRFFVPKGREDVAKYIEQEWEHEIREADNSYSDENVWFWSTNVSIYYFSGSNLYMEQADVKQASQNMMLYLEGTVQKKT